MTEALLPGPAHAVVLEVTVQLDDADPQIFRRLEIRGELTLDLVHELLQAAMGWQDTHLHRFWRGANAFAPQEPRFVTALDDGEDGEDDDGDVGVAESEVRLDQVLRAPGDELGYLYDFGAEWHHTLRVEDVRVASGDEPPAICRDGQGACPPEDIAGIDTYNALVGALAASTPDEEGAALLAEYLDWLPDGFTPGRFDPAETSAAMSAVVETSSALAGLMSTPVVALRTLAERLDGEDLDLVVGLARRVAATPVPTPRDIAEALRPWLVLLDVLGEDGVALTPAGWLRPATVDELARALGVDQWWEGKTTREDQTVPVARLRRSAQASRLVRTYRGRLVRTPAGRRVAGDPDALWEHLAGSLPLDRGDFAQEVGAAWLLCLAAGQDDAATGAAQLVNAAGWRIDDGAPVESWTVPAAAPDTTAVALVMESGYRRNTPRGEAAARQAAAPVLHALAARAVVGGWTHGDTQA